MENQTLPFVVVRTYSAGVHCGILMEHDGKTVKLGNARRLWRWSGANTLNEVATKGPDDRLTRLSEPVAAIVLTEAIEIITASPEAAENLQRSRWAN